MFSSSIVASTVRSHRSSLLASLSCGLALLAVSCERAREGNSPGAVAPPTELTQSPEDKQGEPQHIIQPELQVIAYYFHRTARCPSCRQIEEFSKRSIDEAFAEEIASDALKWRTLNVEQEENERFVKKYDLVGPALVISRLVGGGEAEWKDLELVWDHLGDYVAFWGYVRAEIAKLLKKNDSS